MSQQKARSQWNSPLKVVHQLADLTLYGLTLTGGRSAETGGALRSLGDVTLIEVTASGNSATGDGSNGGFGSIEGSLTVDGATFSGNVVEDRSAGGALSVNGVVSITGADFLNNKAKGDFSVGGAIRAADNVTIISSQFVGNTTAGQFGNGGAVFAGDDLTVTDSVFRNNSTAGSDAEGGAIAVNGDATLTNTAFLDNFTSGEDSDGGALAVFGSINATGVTISGNRTAGEDADGGGVFAFRGITLTGSTVTGNRVEDAASRGGGIFNSQTTVQLADSIVLGNNQAAGVDNEGDDIAIAGVFAPGGRPIFGTGVSILGSGAEVDASVNLITADPTFVFAQTTANGDVLAGAATAPDEGLPFVGLRQSADNPALDAGGLSGVDGRGLPRGVDLLGVDNGGVSDLGAFELQSQFPVAPTITSAATLTTEENQTIAGAVMASDDKPGVTFGITGGADAALFAINAATGALTFKTAPDFEAPGDVDANNVHEVEVTVTDSDAFTATQSLTVTVSNVNEAPVAAASSASGDEDTVILGVLNASDVDGDTLTFSLIDGPSNGSVTIGANGSFQFTPVADFSGTDSFTFCASDGLLSDTATSIITVNPVEEPIDPPASTGPTNGDDTLFGTALNDTINALAGDDNVNGLAGDDVLIGGGGNDSITGGADDDRLRGNGGDDTLKGGGGNDNIKGNGGADVIRGNGGNDVVRAGGGDDNVKGGGGNDLIMGGGGADRLNGGGGADTLKGNGGDDILKGNGGADVFQFRTNDRNDTILDFRQGQDKIQIQNGARSFDALRIEQDGADVLIEFGVAGKIRVVTDNAAAFDESDFIF